MIQRHLKRIIYFIILSLSLSSCVQQPVFKAGDYAIITSGYPIVVLNGEPLENTYRLDIKAGENSLVIVYNTYQYDYFCSFTWTAKAGTAYEVTDHENQYPITLYHWRRKNALWAIRLDPVEPLECTQTARQ